MASVTLESIGKIYPGGVRAVEGVDLHIADGEFVVLVGGQQVKYETSTCPRQSAWSCGGSSGTTTGRYPR